MNTDAQLLEAWRRGERDAGIELFDRHYSAVLHFLRTKVGDDAQDLVQKTFLACVEGMERYDGSGSFRSWLFAIAYRQLCKHYRARAREVAHLDFGTVTAQDLDPSPSGVVAHAQDQRLLLAGLRAIPLEHQVVLELYYWEDMVDSEISRVLGIPLGTARSRIRRARQLLNDRLEALAQSPDQLRDTLDDLERWAARRREDARKQGEEKT